MDVRKSWLLVSMVALVLTVACGGGGETEAPDESAEPAAAPVDDANAGNITGTVMLEGTPLKPTPSE